MLMFILALGSFILSQDVSIAIAVSMLVIVGLMIIMPDVLLAAYPSDILSRKLSATGMGFLTTFTSTAGIISTPLSGKIIDVFDSYAAVFFSFAVVALAGALLTLCIREKAIYEDD